ncbi:Hypothetical predicted protein [Paramuricea clavata]|uniref:Uncharacterized protein n=1 Tax=Paramuricea clavata TaxID=317549 RepID=A0A7D9E1Z8_PARCT|nr:Hypothetical predicted protein [Paramuricea clavata]
MATNLLKNDEWWNGPDWVRNYNPRQAELSKPRNEVLLEAKASKIREVQSTRVHVSAIDEAVGNISKVITCEDYSSVSRLYSVTAYVLRFIENLKRKRQGTSLVKECLTAEELGRAEYYWLLFIQRDVRSDNNYVEKKNRLGLFDDTKGIIRCKGRLANAEISYEEKYPAIIPRKHHFTTITIRDCHSRVGHNGVRETLAEFRYVFGSKGGDR